MIPAGGSGSRTNSVGQMLERSAMIHGLDRLENLTYDYWQVENLPHREWCGLQILAGKPLPHGRGSMAIRVYQRAAKRCACGTKRRETNGARNVAHLRQARLIFERFGLFLRRCGDAGRSIFEGPRSAPSRAARSCKLFDNFVYRGARAEMGGVCSGNRVERKDRRSVR